MGFSVDSKIGEILDEPAAKAVLEKHFPQMASMGPMVAMARGLTLKQVSAFPQAKLTAEGLQAIVQELQKLDKPTG